MKSIYPSIEIIKQVYYRADKYNYDVFYIEILWYVPALSVLFVRTIRVAFI